MMTRRLTLNIHRPCILTARHTSTTKDTKSIQPPNPKRICSDMVGPPDPVSNLRTIIFKEPLNETHLEKRYRELRADVQDWNHKFWTQHNSRFYQVTSQVMCIIYIYYLRGNNASCFLSFSFSRSKKDYYKKIKCLKYSSQTTLRF